MLRRCLGLVCVLAAAFVVAGEGGIPFVSPALRRPMYLAVTAAFFLASASHAMRWRGWRWTAGFLAVTVGGGWLVEVLGVRAGVPFGAYAYSGLLGGQVLGVPLAVPLAWSMMIYAAWCIAERVTARRLARCAVAGLALAVWDLVLDPQMVREGYWAWNATGPTWLGVPLTNFAGWFGASAVMALGISAIGHDSAAPPHRDFRVHLPVPFVLYAWTFLASVCASARWYGVSSSEMIATTGMGVVVCLTAWRLGASPGGAARRVIGWKGSAGTPFASLRAWTRAGL